MDEERAQLDRFVETDPRMFEIKPPPKKKRRPKSKDWDEEDEDKED